MNKELKTSQQWWQETKADEALLVDWLRRQYHGEMTVAGRIERYCIKNLTGATNHWLPTLQRIARDERKHAQWVGELLETRGIRPEFLEHVERYWEQTLPGITDFGSATAVAAHAEAMRLERIRVIAADPDANPDIRDTFQAILADEEFHAHAFAEMAGPDSLKQALEAHLAGQEAIRLVSFAEV